MRRRRRELRALVKDTKITGNYDKLINDYTKMNDCAYEGPIPLPEEFSTMPASTLAVLDSCGAVRASLNSWAIASWSKNAIVKTFENLQMMLDCVSKLPLEPATFNNFQDLVTRCFTGTPSSAFTNFGNYTNLNSPRIRVGRDIRSELRAEARDQLRDNFYNGVGVYGAPYGVYGLPLRSGPVGWRPPNYFNYTSQGSELLDGTDVLMTRNGDYVNTGMLQGYELPRLGFGPYMSRSEIDAEVLPRYEPSQWIVNSGPIRPWHPKYPVMTIPPVPIPLLGTSNM
jgi:hypothetical protein